MDRRRSSTLIPEIYEATINPGHWDYVLEMLARLTESKSACLYYRDKDLGYASMVAQYGCPVDLMLGYKHQYAKLDNLFDKVVTRTETGDILYQVLSRDSDDVIDIESDFYKNWLKPQGIFYLGRVQFLDNNSQKASIAIPGVIPTGPP